MLTEDDFAYLTKQPAQAEPDPAPAPVASQTPAPPTPPLQRPRSVGGLSAQLVGSVVGAANKVGVDPALLYGVAKDIGTSDFGALATKLSDALKNTNNVTDGLTALYGGFSGDTATEVQATRRAVRVGLGPDVSAFRQSAQKYNDKLPQYQAAAKEYFDSLLQAKDQADAERIAKASGQAVLQKYGFTADDAYLLNKQIKKQYDGFNRQIQAANYPKAAAAAAANLPREVDSLANRFPAQSRTGAEIANDASLSLGQGGIGLGKQTFGIAQIMMDAVNPNQALRRNLKAAADAKAASVKQRTSVGTIGGGPVGNVAAGETPTAPAPLTVPEVAEKLLNLNGIEAALQAKKSPYIQRLAKDFDAKQTFAEKAAFLKAHPELAADSAIQSAPGMAEMMLLGGAGTAGLEGKALASQLAKQSSMLEGAQTAGDQTYSNATSPGGLTAGKELAATLAGIGTGAISLGVGKLLPGMDSDVMLAEMLRRTGRTPVTAGGFVKKLATEVPGATAENALEEFLQSGQEKVWENLANGKPADSGVAGDALLGAMAGGMMGGVAGGAHVARSNKIGKPDANPEQASADEVSAAIDELRKPVTAPAAPLALPEPADAKFARENPEIVASAKAKEAAAKDTQALNKNQQPLLPEPAEVTAAKQMPDLSKVSDDQLKYLATQHPNPAVRAEVFNAWEARKLSPENFTLGEKLDVGAPEVAPEPQVDTSKNLDLFAPENTPSQGGVEQKDMFNGWQPAQAQEPQAQQQTAVERNPNQGELDLGTRRKAEWQKSTTQQEAPTQQIETRVTPDVEENRRLAAERDRILAMPVKEAMAAMGVPPAAQTTALRRAQKAGIETGRDLLSAFNSDSHDLSQSNLQSTSGKWAADLGTVLENKLNEWSYANQQQVQAETARREARVSDRALPQSNPLALPEGQKVRQAPKTPGVYQITEARVKQAKVETPAAQPKQSGMWDGLVPHDAKLSVDETDQMAHQTRAADIEHALRSRASLGPVLGKLLDAGKINIAQAMEGNPKAAGSDANGKINLYTSRLPAGKAVPVAVHEAVHAALRQHLGDTATNRLFSKLTDMEKAARNGTGEISRFFKDAAKRIPANTPDEHRGEELGAYAVQKVMEGKAPNGIVAWVKNLVAQVRAALFKATGGKLGKIDEGMLHRLTIQALKGWADKAQVEQAQDATPKAAETDPAREALQWQDVWQNDAGPEYYGKDFSLIATHDYGQIEHDFVDTPKGTPEWPLGHAASVNPDNRVVAFHIAERNGMPAGSLIAEVDPSGQIEAIHDLQILPEMRNSGLGSTIVKQIAANAPGDVRILEAKNADAQRFWSRNGAGYYDIYKNSALSWDSAQAASQRGRNLPRVETDTGATGTDEKATRPVKFSEADDGEHVDFSQLSNEDIAKPAVMSRLAEAIGARKRGYQLQTLRDFVAGNAKYLPSLAPWSKTLFEQQAASNELLQLGNEVMADVNSLGKAKATELLRLMQEESFNNVFASKELPATAEEQQRIAHMRLAAQFNKFSPEQKAAYEKIRSALGQQWEHIHSALRKLVIATIHDPAKQHSALQEIEDRYRASKDAPYFPLQRHGKYFAVGYDVDGKGGNLLVSYDSHAEAKSAVEHMKQRGVTKTAIYARPSSDTFDKSAVPAAGFLNDLHNAIDNNIGDSTERDSMHLALQNLYLQALPEFSGAKKMLGRSAKPVMGFDADARRALAVSLFSGARYASQLEYAPRINSLMRDMEAEAAGRAVPHVFVRLDGTPRVDVFTKSYDNHTAAEAYIDKPGMFASFNGSTQALESEMPERLKQMRAVAEKNAKSRNEKKKASANVLLAALTDENIARLTKEAVDKAGAAVPEAPAHTDLSVERRVLDEVKRRDADRAAVPDNAGRKIARSMLTLSYINYLGGNVSTALNNAMQVPLITLPYMTSKLGATASVKLTKYGAFAAKQVIPHLYNELVSLGIADPMVIHKIKGLTEGQRTMLIEAQKAGLLDYTVAADLANIVHNTSDAADRTMRMMSGFNHWAEVWNRMSTALAAYEGHMEKFGSSHDTASAYVQEVLWKTHGDNSQLNTAPVMKANRSPIMLATTQFQKFPLAMVELNKGLVKQAFGANPQARAEAFKALAGMYFMGWLASGPLAMPFASTFAAIIQAAVNMGKGADDDEFDIRTWWRHTMQQKDIPPWLQDTIIGGVARSLLNADDASRVGTGDILPVVKLSQSVPRKNENSGDATARFFADSLGGPTFSTLDSIWRGSSQLKDDLFNPLVHGTDNLRGLQTMLPRAIANPMKAYVLASSGLEDQRHGDIIKPEAFSKWDIANQALGFKPAQVADYYDDMRNFAVDAKKATDRVTELARKYADASLRGDATAEQALANEIDAFYKANPYGPSIKGQLSSAVRAPLKDQAWRDATGGQAANKAQLLQEMNSNFHEGR